MDRQHGEGNGAHFFFFSSRRRHTRCSRDWSSDVCSSDLFCQSIFDPEAEEIFLIAANDGQLVESWRRLKETDAVKRARQVFEELLVEDRQEQTAVRLKFFNLSRASSADLFDRVIDAFLNHPGWKEHQESL